MNEEMLDGRSVKTGLYRDLRCRWPNCNAPCLTVQSFLAHLSQAHKPSDIAMFQLKIKSKIVHMLRSQLEEEEELYDHMLKFLCSEQEFLSAITEQQKDVNNSQSLSWQPASSTSSTGNSFSQLYHHDPTAIMQSSRTSNLSKLLAASDQSLNLGNSFPTGGAHIPNGGSAGRQEIVVSQHSSNAADLVGISSPNAAAAAATTRTILPLLPPSTTNGGGYFQERHGILENLQQQQQQPGNGGNHYNNHRRMSAPIIPTVNVSMVGVASVGPNKFDSSFDAIDLWNIPDSCLYFSSSNSAHLPSSFRVRTSGAADSDVMMTDPPPQLIPKVQRQSSHPSFHGNKAATAGQQPDDIEEEDGGDEEEGDGDGGDGKETPRTKLTVENDLQMNRELYQIRPVRPRHSYAALIRMAILESKTGRLKLPAIYDWFTDTFAFYRMEKKLWWKSGIRHTLSIRKCFIKTTDNYGAYWEMNPSREKQWLARSKLHVRNYGVAARRIESQAGAATRLRRKDADEEDVVRPSSSTDWAAAHRGGTAYLLEGITTTDYSNNGGRRRGSLPILPKSHSLLSLSPTNSAGGGGLGRGVKSPTNSASLSPHCAGGLGHEQYGNNYDGGSSPIPVDNEITVISPEGSRPDKIQSPPFAPEILAKFEKLARLSGAVAENNSDNM